MEAWGQQILAGGPDRPGSEAPTIPAHLPFRQSKLNTLARGARRIEVMGS